MDSTGGLPAPGRRRRRLVLAAVFLGLPLAVYGVPAAFGIPWLDGDNLIQNFPLRVLVGSDLRAGHFPLWNPYIWSGAPLIGGFNAGAAYPMTWLFAVLGHVPAWLAGQVVVVVVAASGMFSLLRFQGRSFTAAALGAAAFSYGGFMAAQSVHIDLVEAAGWLVWAVVALDRMAHRPEGRPIAPWVALLGVALGLMVLTGAAEPILDGSVALVLFALWLIWHTPGRRVQVLLGAVGGVLLGALVGAAQWLPGAAIQGQSQRALHSYWYFTSGSMNKSLTVLALDPLLLGGAHAVPLSYTGTYNLAEISGYVGIVAVMALFGLLAKRHRRHPEATSWWIWYVIAGVGLVLVWGDFTPLGHLAHVVPFYNRQRLLSRNWLEVDLALSVLFAAWVDHMLLAPRPQRAEPAHGIRRWPSDVVLPLVPVAAVVALQVILLAGGPWLPHFMHVPQKVSYSVLWPHALLLTIPSALAVTAGWLVLSGPRSRRRLSQVLVAVVAADLVFFNVMIQSPPQTGTAAGSSPQATALAAVTAAAGEGGEPSRMAIYDPDRYYSEAANAIGQPDLNVLRHIRSVQGYGAIVAGDYDTATGTHIQGNLSLDALSNGTLEDLGLGVLVVPPQYFVSLAVAPPGVRATLPGTTGPTPAATALPPVPPDRRAPVVPAVAPPSPAANASSFAPPPSPRRLVPGQSVTWYFGTVLAVSNVALPVWGPGATSASHSRLRVGLLGPDGSTVTWMEGPAGVQASSTVRARAPGAPGASGLVLELLPPAGVSSGPASAVQVDSAVVSTAGQGVYRTDGGLRDIVGAPQWRFAGTLDHFAVFEQHAAGAVSLRPVGAGVVRVLSDPPWGAERIEVRSHLPVTVVRNEAFAAGWQASISPVPGADGPTRTVSVKPEGLIQSLQVPAGDHEVVFRYRPKRVEAGLVASAVGLVLAAGLVIAGRRPLRRRSGPGRRRAVAPPSAAPTAGAPDGVAPALVPSETAPPTAGPPRRGP